MGKQRLATYHLSHQVLFRAIYVGATLSALGGACQRPVAESDVQHVWGQTSRDTEAYAFQECDNSEPDYRPAYHQFIRELGEYIMAATPETFRGKVAPSKFCWRVDENKELNAYADMPTRTIAFQDGVLASGLTVEETAAVMGHELAHVTLLHSSLPVHPSFTPSPAYDELKRKVVEKNEELSQLHSSLPPTDAFESFFGENPDAYRIYYKNIEQLRKKYRDGLDSPELAALEQEIISSLPYDLQGLMKENLQARKSVFQRGTELDDDIMALSNAMKSVQEVDPAVGAYEPFNWEEREADEVGFEFLVRAGFPESGWTGAYAALALSNIPADELELCLAKGENTESLGGLEKLLHGTEVERGRENHPHACWRILHGRYERMLHRDDLGRLPAREVPQFLRDLHAAALEEYKSEISGQKADRPKESGATQTTDTPIPQVDPSTF